MRRTLAIAALLWCVAAAAHAQGTLRVYGDYPNVTVTGTLTETILASVPIPAGAMPANGMARLTWTATMTNNADTKTINLRYGTAAGVTGAVISNSVQTTIATQQSIWILRNRGVTNGQTIYGTNVPYGTTTNGNSSPSLDSTAATFMNITATLTNVADSITLNGWTLEVIMP